MRNTISIKIIKSNNNADLFGQLFERAELLGILTTDHAASSHGLPVVVVDGVVYGPAELDGDLAVADSKDPNNRALLITAKSAGYSINHLVGEAWGDSV